MVKNQNGEITFVILSSLNGGGSLFQLTGSLGTPIT
jgi:hypothetical protein